MVAVPVVIACMIFFPCASRRRRARATRAARLPASFLFINLIIRRDQDPFTLLNRFNKTYFVSRVCIARASAAYRLFIGLNSQSSIDASSEAHRIPIAATSDSHRGLIGATSCPLRQLVACSSVAHQARIAHASSAYRGLIRSASKLHQNRIRGASKAMPSVPGHVTSNCIRHRPGESSYPFPAAFLCSSGERLGLPEQE